MRQLTLAIVCVFLAACSDTSLTSHRPHLVVPASLSLGTAVVGTTHVFAWSVENQGLGSASLQSVEVTATDMTVVLPELRLEGGHQISMAVTWNPSVEGALSGALLLHTSEGVFVTQLLGHAIPVPTCDDANPCTTDVFDMAASICTHPPREGSCDDDNACTTDGVCVSGVCLSAAVECEDDNPCTLDGCDAEQGCVFTENQSLCDDGNACTQDSCDPIQGCMWVAVPDFSQTCRWTTCAMTHLCVAGTCTALELPPVEGQVCEPEVWYGLGGSDFGPWTQHLTSSAGGGGLNDFSAVSNIHFATDLAGQPTIALNEQEPNDRPTITIKRFVANQWETLNTSSLSQPTDMGIYVRALALDGLGQPVVSLERAEQNWVHTNFYVHRYTGAGWEMLGEGPINTANLRGECTLATSVSGDVAVAWDESDNPRHRVLRWTNNAWHSVDNLPGDNGSYTDQPSLLFDGENTLWSAWTTGSGVQRLKLAQWTGAAWSLALDRVVEAPAAYQLLKNAAGRPVMVTQGLTSLEVGQWTGNSWQSFTQALPQNGAYEFAAAVNEQGLLQVVWNEYAAPLVWHRLREQGQTWVDEPFAAPPWAPFYSGLLQWQLAPSSTGSTLAWVSWGRAFVAQQTPEGWQEFGQSNMSEGGLGDGLTAAQNPAIVFDSQGAPVVAWSAQQAEDSPALQVHLRRYDNQVWQGSTFPLVNTGVLALATKNSGESVLALHHQLEATALLMVAENEGAVWNTLSDTDLGVVEGRVAMVMNHADEPIVAWDAPGGSGAVYIRRFDGNAWVEMGEGSATGEGVSGFAAFGTGVGTAPALSLTPDGDVVLALMKNGSSQNAVYRVGRFSADEWLAVGPELLADERVNPGRMGVATLADGSAVVAWVSNAGDLRAYHFDGTQWQSAATLSAGGAVSNGPLAQDHAGNLFLTWAAVDQIYVARWDGTLWTELSGSASESGISRSTAGSYSPAIAAHDGEVCVTWTERAFLERKVVVRCALWD